MVTPKRHKESEPLENTTRILRLKEEKAEEKAASKAEQQSQLYPLPVAPQTAGMMCVCGYSI